MKLYIMRHGPAEDDSPTGRDADRALTPSGRGRVRDVAHALVAESEAPLGIVSSPLVRALQTAEIVASIANVGTVEVRAEMAPGGDKLALLAELVSTGRKRVMVVGHEPDLSMLSMRLIGRMPPNGMMKAMVVGAKLTPSQPGIQGIDERGGAERGARLPFDAAERFILDPKTLAWDRSRSTA